MLVDVLKNCQFVSKKKDEVIIRQGELGDWYISYIYIDN